MSQASGIPAVCEIDGCGVLAVGRCSTCKRAFCASHQGYGRDGFMQPVPYIDMCAPCMEAKNAADAKQKEEELAPELYFQSGTARKELLASGVQSTTLYERMWEWKVTKRDFLGRSQREQVEKLVPAGRGWILGKLTLRWEVRQYDNYGNETKEYLIALRDEPPRLYNQGLTNVESCPGGYVDLEGKLYAALGPGYWKEAMEAVKRLMGK